MVELVSYPIYILLLCYSLYTFFVLNLVNKFQIAHFNRMIEKIPISNNSLTFVWGSSLPYRYIYVFDDYTKFGKANLIIGAWTQQSPYDNLLLKKFDITNLYKGLYEKDNVFLVVADRYRELLQRFMKEHYNKDISFVTVIDFQKEGFPSELVKVKIKL